jgi:hypothetical protein
MNGQEEDMKRKTKDVRYDNPDSNLSYFFPSTSSCPSTHQAVKLELEFPIGVPVMVSLVPTLSSFSPFISK